MTTMSWLVDEGEVLAGTAAMVLGFLLTFLFPADQPMTMRLTVLPIGGLMLMLFGAAMLLRGLRLV